MRIRSTFVVTFLLAAVLALGPPTPAVAARQAPGPGAALTGVAQVVAGNDFTCARLISGEARCWGRNNLGQLGDGTTTDRPTPVAVVDPQGNGPLTGVAELATGGFHACARLNDGQVRCWGFNRFGQLGDGTTIDRLRPVAVSNPEGTGPLTGAAQITTGHYHSCALLASPGIRCWGYNGFQQLADFTTTDRLRPIDSFVSILGLLDVEPTQVTAGLYHTCLVVGPRSNGICGGRNVYGQLGADSPVASDTSLIVSGVSSLFLLDVLAYSAGGDHTCARKDTNRLVCWGRNSTGQIGDGTTTNRPRPVAVRTGTGFGSGTLRDVRQVSSGLNHTCVVLTSGQGRCWGFNPTGGVGDGTTTNRLLPVPVKNVSGAGRLVDIAQIDAGSGHTCARLSSRQVRCWGRNTYGQLGNGATTDTSLPVIVLT